MSSQSKKVLVFGVFDILHDGHRYFLESAKALGDKLFVVLAPDEAVLDLKKNHPHNPLALRMKNLETEKIADHIFEGDSKSGSWNIFTELIPDIIALGYDQEPLGKALETFLAQTKHNVKLVRLFPHNDETLHSSSLRKNLKKI
ncbi:MAG: adenylyltransferase/cytidyltransferase family protein [Patescibacteria group bacterium]